MSKYYLKETSTLDLYKEQMVSLFLLDFEKDTFEWLLCANDLDKSNDGERGDMTQHVINHMNYIKSKDIKRNFDIITETEAEELMFMLGI